VLSKNPGKILAQVIRIFQSDRKAVHPISGEFPIGSQLLA
jgi:hypothetical protein